MGRALSRRRDRGTLGVARVVGGCTAVVRGSSAIVKRRRRARLAALRVCRCQAKGRIIETCYIRTAAGKNGAHGHHANNSEHTTARPLDDCFTQRTTHVPTSTKCPIHDDIR